MGRPAAPVMAAHQTVPQCVPGQPCQLGLEHCQGAWSPGDARSATTDIHKDSTGHSMSHLSTSITAYIPRSSSSSSFSALGKAGVDFFK